MSKTIACTRSAGSGVQCSNGQSILSPTMIDIKLFFIGESSINISDTFLIELQSVSFEY